MPEWGVPGDVVATYRGWFIYERNRWGLYAANQDVASYYCLVSDKSMAGLFKKIDKEVD